MLGTIPGVHLCWSESRPGPRVSLRPLHQVGGRRLARHLRRGRAQGARQEGVNKHKTDELSKEERKKRLQFGKVCVVYESWEKWNMSVADCEKQI